MEYDSAMWASACLPGSRVDICGPEYVLVMEEPVCESFLGFRVMGEEDWKRAVKPERSKDGL